MRREQITLEVSNIGWFDGDGDPETPTLTVVYDGDTADIRDWLRNPTGDTFEANETDITIRLQGNIDDSAAEGVVAMTDRVTGEYILEFNVDVEDILKFIRAARRYAERTEEGSRYRILIASDDEEIATYEKRTLLVYSEDGELLRQHSLIPSGVEI